MRIRLSFFVLVALLGAVFLVGCGIGEGKDVVVTGTRVLTSTIKPLDTISPTNSPQPTGAFTLEPTGSPSPTSTPSAKPTIPESLSSLVIAYTQYNEIWAWENGEAKLLTKTSVDLPIMYDYGRIALSDDGRKIAFIDNEYEIWVIDTNGSNESLLISHDVINEVPISELAGSGRTIVLPYQLQWLPKSHTFIVNTLGWLATSLYQLDIDLYSVNSVTGNTEKYSWEAARYFYPSPDGEKMAYVEIDRIGLMNNNGSKQKSLIEFQLIYISEWFINFYYPEIIWSQDNQAFSVIIPPQLNDESTSNLAKLWKVNLDSSTQLLAELPWTDHQYWYPLSKISSDFSFYTYILGHPENDSQDELHLVSTDLGQDIFVYTGIVESIDWSPTSKSYLFVTADEKDNIFIGDIKGNSVSLPIGERKVIEAEWINEESIFLITEDALYVAIVGSGNLIHLSDIEHWTLNNEYSISK